MIIKNLYLSEDLYQKGIKKLPTRDGFGVGVVEAAEVDDKIVCLTADLAGSTRLDEFEKKFYDRFVEVGVAEQALATIASGMANYGKIPFITSFAIFSPGRNWEQIRTTICLNNLPVKIISSHAGLNVGADGATHQSLEDLALTLVLPNITVISPCDAQEARKATIAAAKTKGPVYMRLTRDKFPIITSEKTPFEIGKAQVFYKSKKPELAIVATGPMVYGALLSARKLQKEGIGSWVVNCATIKPLDSSTIVNAAKVCGAVVCAEEHQITGGMGSAVAQMLTKTLPKSEQVPVEFVGVDDSFGESARNYKKLWAKYHLTNVDISKAAKKVITRKNS